MFVRRFFLVLGFLFLSATDGEIKERTAALEEAVNRKDAKAVAALWTEEGVYQLPDSGGLLKGRSEIEAAFDSIFKEKKDLHVVIKVETVQFPTENEAVEKGFIETSGGAKLAFEIHYVKSEADWQIASLSETSENSQPTHFEKLSGLEWLLGNWIDKSGDVEIKTETSWDKYKNFLTQHFVITSQGNLVLEGRQIIGWDPIKKEIRSWMFDSDGGFGEGSWKKSGESWMVTAGETLADGSRASSINIYTPIDSDSYSWQSEGRMVGSDLLPSIAPVTIKRVK